MRKILFSVLLIAILIFPFAVSAQGEVSIESLQIEFWPEYDRPDLLVLYNIQLPEDTIFPVELSFRIPAVAGEPNAVAVALENQWVNAKYTTEIQGEWTVVSFVTDSTLAHLEYYDPTLIKDGTYRNFEFTWLGDHPVNFLQFKVQEPVDTSGMNLSHTSSDAIPEAGLNYYYSEFNDIKQGDSFKFSVSYNKTSNDLTSLSSSEPVAATEEDSSPLSSQINSRVLLGIFAVVLIAFGIYNNFKPKKSNRRGSRRRPSGRSTMSGRKNESQKNFCHSCGASGSKKDKFCRECGEKRRS